MTGSVDLAHHKPAPLARSFPVLLALLLAACSTPGGPGSAPVGRNAAERSLLTLVALQEKLYQVAAPLLINNADLCREQARNLLGFTAKNKYSYPGAYAGAAQSVLNYSDSLQVTGVLLGSGAAQAGLRKGDGLSAVDGNPLPGGPNAETDAAAIFAPLVSSNKTIVLNITRGAANKQLQVPVTRACAFRIDPGNTDNINSYADGKRIVITRGMINFAGSNEDVAFVMATDMAHNILGHAAQQHAVATIGSVMDNVTLMEPDLSMLTGSAGLTPMPAALDVEADRLALYLLARAGYNIDRAAAFWQKLARQYPASVANGYTANHPETAARLAAINLTVAEIKTKQARKLALLP